MPGSDSQPGRGGSQILRENEKNYSYLGSFLQKFGYISKHFSGIFHKTKKSYFIRVSHDHGLTMDVSMSNRLHTKFFYQI